MNFLTSLCKILRFLIIYFKNLFMKFTAFILLLLTSIFLIACSANQANKKISNSELENLAKQYGGVYIFDEKFEKEIERQEQIRDSKRKFDYINAAQIIFDLMQEYGYIEDDDSTNVIPIFKGYKVDKIGAGVKIEVL